MVSWFRPEIGRFPDRLEIHHDITFNTAMLATLCIAFPIYSGVHEKQHNVKQKYTALWKAMVGALKNHLCFRLDCIRVGQEFVTECFVETGNKGDTIVHIYLIQLNIIHNATAGTM